ncbi:hypothetical protein [Pseudomonas sp. Sample_9]|jgi:hypothetical protein|uniref:hypothetical protein n=1 Tax=Pseudomonas sp. Sample_9 TaxID=2382158 RepID=UPI0015B25B23|nr:hypothetical protein [Pseudomonas sp. Sample_9]
MDNAQPDNAVMTLHPVKIHLATEGVIIDPSAPDEVPVLGLPLGIFKEVTRNGVLAAGVQVLIDPPLDVGQYDAIRLYVNGVQSGDAQPVINERMTFTVFQSEFRDSVNNIVHYILKNVSGNDSKSIETWVRYHDTLPGGNAVPGTGDHPGLMISLPEQLGDPAVIGQPEATKGVLLTFHYPYCRAYDLVTYEIHRQRFTHTVTVEQAGKTFSVLIDFAKFQLIGSLKNCPFSYTMVDQLLNPTHQRRWSKSIFANIDLERTWLGMPLLREDTSDNTDDPKIVDLDKINKSLSVVVRPNDPLYQIGDLVTAFYRLDDSAEKATDPSVFPADDYGDLAACVVPIAKDQFVSGKRLKVRFKVERPAGTIIGHSRTAEAEIIGTVVDEKPVITRVIGTVSGKDIVQGAITVETAVTLTGTAATGQLVDVRDGNIIVDQAKADATTGVWTYAVASLTTEPHSFTAKARYGSEQSSLAWAFTVTASKRPTIESVKGLTSGEEIPDGSKIEETTVILSGFAAKGQEVDVFDWEDSVSKSPVDPLTGKWALTVPSLDPVMHSFTVKGLYGAEEVSPPRTLTVTEGYDDLATFTDNNMNGWSFHYDFGSLIKQGEEFFIRSKNINGANRLVPSKSYEHLQSGLSCTLSFDYLATSPENLFILLGSLVGYDVVELPHHTFASTNTWRSLNIKCYLGLPETKRYSTIIIGHENAGVFSLDNLRLKASY